MCCTIWTKKILLPNSIKITIVINNLVCQQLTTDGGFAIGALLLTKRTVSNINTSNASVLFEVPNRPSSQTSLIELQGDATLDQDSGFFSFDKQAFLGLLGNDTIDINPSTGFLENFNSTDFNMEYYGAGTRFYFSIVNKSVSSIEWSTAVGIDEYIEKINSSSSCASALIIDNNIAIYIYDIIFIFIYALYK